MAPKSKTPAKKLKSLTGRGVDASKSAKVKGGTLKFRLGKGMRDGA